jgi:hypothetical protein
LSSKEEHVRPDQAKKIQMNKSLFFIENENSIALMSQPNPMNMTHGKNKVACEGENTIQM